MANAPQKESIAPRSVQVEQCPGCPPGNSLPLVANEETCGQHGWWHAHNYTDH